jgi:hypothetical protein
MTQQGDKQALQKLDELYASIPKTHCRRFCSQCCGPVVFSRLEWERIPDPLRKNATSLICPYSGELGRCEIYDLRPLLCRLYGVVERMYCPHANPERILTKGEEDAILATYAQILRF